MCSLLVFPVFPLPFLSSGSPKRVREGGWPPEKHICAHPSAKLLPGARPSQQSPSWRATERRLLSWIPNVSIVTPPGSQNDSKMEAKSEPRHQTAAGANLSQTLPGMSGLHVDPFLLDVFFLLFWPCFCGVLFSYNFVDCAP